MECEKERNLIEKFDQYPLMHALLPYQTRRGDLQSAQLLLASFLGLIADAHDTRPPPGLNWPALTSYTLPFTAREKHRDMTTS